jgi:hypothetical protein
MSVGHARDLVRLAEEVNGAEISEGGNDEVSEAEEELPLLQARAHERGHFREQGGT